MKHGCTVGHAEPGAVTADPAEVVPVGSVYHPDPDINAAIARDVLDAEVLDLRAGLAPRRWQCPSCGRSHERGHHLAIGQHRCLSCGYVGTGGVMYDETETPPALERARNATRAQRAAEVAGEDVGDVPEMVLGKDQRG